MANRDGGWNGRNPQQYVVASGKSPCRIRRQGRDQGRELIRVEGDDDNPITTGRVNAMNLALREYTYAPERIIHPMKRAYEIAARTMGRNHVGRGSRHHLREGAVLQRHLRPRVHRRLRRHRP